MASIPPFFVVAFSRTEASEFRAEVAMKALSEEHAASLASHFAGEGEGAVAFSQRGDLSTAERGGVEILARLGDVTDDRAALKWFGDACAPGRPDITSMPAHQLAIWMSVAHSLQSVLSRIMYFAVERERSPRLALAIASLVAVIMAGSGSAMLVITARAAQRETWIVEMARPVCDHTSITNEELHHLIKFDQLQSLGVHYAPFVNTQGFGARRCACCLGLRLGSEQSKQTEG